MPITIWTDTMMKKVKRDAAAGVNSPISLKCAKNEFVLFQVSVKGAANNVNASVSGLPLDHLVTIYVADYLNITTRSTTQGTTGFHPDALVPKEDIYFGETRNYIPFNIPSGQVRTFWIEVYIPEDSDAGTFEGTVDITATEGNASAEFSIEVYDFAIPSTSSLESAFGASYINTPSGHGLGSFNNSQAHRDLHKLYTKALLLHRLSNAYTVTGASLEGNNADGSPRWTQYDALWSGLFDGTEELPGDRLPGAKFSAISMGSINSSSYSNSNYVAGYISHFKAKGWFDRLFQYIFDEPSTQSHFNTISSKADVAHAAGDGTFKRVMATTWKQKADDFSFNLNKIDLWCPTIRMVDNKEFGHTSGSEVPGGEDTSGNQRGIYPTPLWWYQACGSHGCGFMGGDPSIDPQGYRLDWPAYMVDLPHNFSRVMEWLAFIYNIQGELYYHAVESYGQIDPWTNQFLFGGNGDGTLFYPGTPAKIGGTTHIPIDSIRLKLIRAGYQDYELLKKLKDLGEENFARTVALTVGSRTFVWSKSEGVYDTARAQLLDKIAELLAPIPEIPNPPQSVSLSAADRQIEISWSNSPGAISYNIYWNSIGNVTNQSNKITGATSPHLHTGLTNGQVLYYRVAAVGTGGEGDLSSEVSAASVAPPPPPPNPPTLLSVSPGNSQNEISWNPTSGATSYNIYFKTSSGVTKNDSKITGAVSTHTHSGLTNGTEYFYRIASVGPGGEGELSSEISATPAVAAIPVPPPTPPSEIPPPNEPEPDAILGEYTGTVQFTVTILRRKYPPA